MLAELLLAATTTLAGDFNNDGRVDNFDFLEWQRTSTDATELQIWSENLGATAPRRDIPVAADFPSQQQWYSNNATYTDSFEDSADFTFASPESLGMSSAAIATAAADLDDFSRLRSLLVLREGTIVHEQYFGGATRFQARNLHSASKSILATLVGIAIEQGHIDGVDTTLASLAPEYFANYSPTDQRREITIEHLLEMESGLHWSEDVDEYENPVDRAQFVLDQGLRRTPGTSFRYSTGNTQLLAGGFGVSRRPKLIRLRTRRTIRAAQH